MTGNRALRIGSVAVSVVAAVLGVWWIVTRRAPEVPTEPRITAGPVSFAIEAAQVGRGCPERSSDLTLSSAALGQRTIPLKTGPKDAQRFDVLRAVYSGSWAESRILEVRSTESSVEVQASFETDYGNGAGAIDAASSSVQVDAECLCFDLGVTRFDGSNQVERWVGRIAR